MFHIREKMEFKENILGVCVRVCVCVFMCVALCAAAAKHTLNNMQLYFQFSRTILSTSSEVSEENLM